MHSAGQVMAAMQQLQLALSCKLYMCFRLVSLLLLLLC
jgi:hypothetical protein